MLQAAPARGHLHASWVAGDDAFGRSPTFRDGVAAAGLRYVLDVPPQTPVWSRTTPAMRQSVAARRQALAPTAWQVLTVADGSQGPRTYGFGAERVRETRQGQPGQELWVAYRQNLDGRSPRYYLSNAPADTPLAPLAAVGGARWGIETEFETAKSDVGLDEYETRTWAGGHHHITLCLWAGAFLLSLQQDWGQKKPPPDAAAGLPGGTGVAAPGPVWPPGRVALAAGRPATQRTGAALP